ALPPPGTPQSGHLLHPVTDLPGRTTPPPQGLAQLPTPPSGASAPTRIRPSTYPTVASRDHNLDPSACGELLFLGRISSVWNRIPSCIGASLSVTSHEIRDKSSFLTNRECCLRVLGPESCGPACPKLRSARIWINTKSKLKCYVMLNLIKKKNLNHITRQWPPNESLL